MTVKVRPLGRTCGAEFVGVDVTRPLSPAMVGEIEDAFVKHKVLLFRQQPMTAQQLAAFGRHFGALQPHVQKRYRHPEVPEVVVMTNRRPDGAFDEIGAARGAAERTRDGWHSDLAYDPCPAKATLLHAVEIPSRGGNTCFANMAIAFRRLSTERQRRLAELRAAFVYGGHTRNKATALAAQALEEAERNATSAVHPVVVAHPDTGEPAIFPGPYMTSHILGVPAEESEAILDEIAELAEDPDIRWEHVWSVGDTLMWDNRGGLLHTGRMDYPRNEARCFLRITIRGGPTTAYRWAGAAKPAYES